MGIHRTLCFLWLAITSLILWVNATNIHVKEGKCGNWKCDGLEIGGQTKGGPRKFLMSCNKEIQDPNNNKKTITIYQKNCLRGNPHLSSFYNGPNKNKITYYEALRDKICQKFDDKTGKAILKGRPVDNVNPENYLYDEVLQGTLQGTGRRFTKAELDILRRNGHIDNHTKYGKVIFRQGARKGAHGGYQRVDYQLQDQFKPERYLNDNYGINWDELNPAECS